MKSKTFRIFAAISVLTMCALCIAPAVAQNEAKEKPPMYTYVSDWTIPRAQWGDMAKNTAADEPVMQKALASGTIVGYGDDTNLVHQNDSETQDEWWSSMSMAGLMNVLDTFYKGGNAVTPVLGSATKHSDEIFVSRYYNWKPGTYKDAYTHGSSYKLKADAPDDAVATMSKNFLVPMFEKLLADGSVIEYEIDTQAIHTDAPGTFMLFYITPNADGLDKVNAALQATLKSSPLSGPAFGSMVDFTHHRDELARTNAVYK